MPRLLSVLLVSSALAAFAFWSLRSPLEMRGAGPERRPVARASRVPLDPPPVASAAPGREDASRDSARSGRAADGMRDEPSRDPAGVVASEPTPRPPRSDVGTTGRGAESAPAPDAWAGAIAPPPPPSEGPARGPADAPSAPRPRMSDAELADAMARASLPENPSPRALEDRRGWSHTLLSTLDPEARAEVEQRFSD